jgi:hypothetical protein
MESVIAKQKKAVAKAERKAKKALDKAELARTKSRDLNTKLLVEKSKLKELELEEDNLLFESHFGIKTVFKEINGWITKAKVDQYHCKCCATKVDDCPFEMYNPGFHVPCRCNIPMPVLVKMNPTKSLDTM